ncbi:TadE/TadG family type IV pilus assembly protein [Alkalihalobacterium bogoriense]|uniref:TadE/TadG family type IV pilus assembly protein n=1 Tax=Alkalihalobacterium bogoriense TaxID=246272 RepID=UPI000556D985|nr:TadE family protein [Alkalihalobacterium bogoriense]
MKNIKKYIHNEKGSQMIEFLAVFPLIIFALLFIWQVALIAYSVVVTEAAARDGARVAAVHDDYNQAVNNSAFGLDVTNVTRTESSGSYGAEVTVSVTTRVPVVQLPFIGAGNYTITSDATMPLEEAP